LQAWIPQTETAVLTIQVSPTRYIASDLTYSDSARRRPP
jgi:hypothetical protein